MKNLHELKKVPKPSRRSTVRLRNGIYNFDNFIFNTNAFSNIYFDTSQLFTPINITDRYTEFNINAQVSQTFFQELRGLTSNDV